MTKIADVAARTVERGDVQWQEGADGRIRITRRKFGPFGSGLLRMFRISPDLRVTLDPLGSEVWRLLDGERSVAEVLAELQSEFPDEPDLARRLGEYLSTLAGNRLVAFRD